MKRTFFPKTRLSKLMERPGGITRDEALTEAQNGVEEMRDVSAAEIEKAIFAIEQFVAETELSPEEMSDILRHGDRIVTLAGTFGYAQLDAVVRSLCDVTGGLLATGSRDAAPIAVHARAMRLIAPNAKPLAKDDTDRILAELSKVAAHFEFTSFENSAADLAEQPSAAAGVR